MFAVLTGMPTMADRAKPRMVFARMSHKSNENCKMLVISASRSTSMPKMFISLLGLYAVTIRPTSALARANPFLLSIK